MHVGIKVGPDADSIERLARSNAEFVEVWYDANKPDSYTDLFDTLKKTNTPAGLHFWAVLPDKTLANLAYPDADVSRQTVRLMKETIDMAARINSPYVNIHPGGQSKTIVDFTTDSFLSISDPAPFEQCRTMFLEHVIDLHEYARSRNVILTVETVPQREMNRWYEPDSRSRPIQTHLLPVTVLMEAANRSIWIANDFCHTASNIISDTPEAVWSFVLGVTTKLAPNTRLIHAGFVVPPYNGTDFHDSYENPLFTTASAIPNHNQTIELLRLFNNRDDVYILAEPSRNHRENYILVKNLVDAAAKS